jgi:superfamily II DNA or RNA helicase
MKVRCCLAQVLTEGFDEPSIDAILMARPTRSPGLYTQVRRRVW